MAGRKDNRWHGNPLFSNSPSRRTYWWEIRQDFPESQSLSKELLHFHDSGRKNFGSVSITVSSAAVEVSPHLLHRVPLNHGEMKLPQPGETFLHPYNQDNESPGCYQLPIYYFTHKVMHPLVMMKSPSGFPFPTSCWHHPFGVFFASPFKNLCAFLSGICAMWLHLLLRGMFRDGDPGQGITKPCRCLCCRWHSGLAQPRPNPGLCLPSPCSWIKQRHKTGVRANCHH